MSGRGRFLVLDGVDGCGKSTQAKLLAEHLAGSLHVREPGTTVLGEQLRRALLDGREDLDAGVEALLFAAARRHLLRTVVEPALAAGRDVVCERFHGSTFAYQGEAGGLGGEYVLALLESYADTPRPDLELILDLAPSAAAQRRSGATDRIEARGLAFQERVAAGYRRYAKLRRSARLVDATGGAREVHERVLAEVLGAHR